MLSTENPLRALLRIGALAAVAWMCGCSPPAHEVLMEGDRALREGDVSRAIQKLKRATELNPQEPRAWNLLGLAYHRGAQPQLAEHAYRQALSRDRSNLVAVAHYNLGCLLLEENKPAAAADELRSFSMISNYAPAFVRLGSAQLRLRQWDLAERSFAAALRLQSGDVHALNGLGVAHAGRRRTRESLQYFNAALQRDAQFAPALLNSAILLQQEPSSKAAALERYQKYLALHPTGESVTGIRAVALQLEQELTPTPPPTLQLAATSSPQPTVATNVILRPAARQTVAVTSPAPAITSVLTLASSAQPTNTPSTPQTTPTPPVTREPTLALVPQTNFAASAAPVTNVAAARATATATNPGPEAVPPVPANLPITVAEVTAPTPVRPATAEPAQPEKSSDEVPSPTIREPVLETTIVTQPTLPVDTTRYAETKAEKPGFLTRLNPFRKREPREPKDEPRRVVVLTSVSTNPPPAEAGPLPVYPHYAFLNPGRPASGDRTAAERAFREGTQAERAGDLIRARSKYQEATRSDPSYFDACYNEALLALRTGDVHQSLVLWEKALAIEPDSLNTRYNFALALKQANYVHEAVSELERVLEAKPGEVRAHLAAGNIYAQQLRDKARARAHYRKVLQLDPRNAQAAAIRFWLASNP